MTKRLTSEEIALLRDLARQVQEIAAKPKWAEKEILWKKINSLQRTRPMVMFPPECWQELIPPETYVVKDPLFSQFEEHLKQQIYRDKYLHDDIIITNKLYVPYTASLTDWVENRIRPYANNHYQAEHYHPCILEVSDLKKMQKPQLSVDFEKSRENYELAQEIFGDYLDVVQGEPFNSNAFPSVLGWGTSLVDIWCELRGMENVFYDLYDEPEFTKEAMKFLMEGTMGILDEGIRHGIWNLNNNGYINNAVTPAGSNGMSNTNELPSPEYNGKVQLKDLWGYCMAQEFTSVSPDMLEEFVLPYQKQIAAKFGLNSYGCCENNDLKWDVIKRNIPNLREVSVSAYSNLQIAVNNLQDQYVLSWKAHPTDILSSNDPERIRKYMEQVMKIAKDTHFVMGLREVRTVFNEPQRAINWIDISMELAQNFA